MQESVAVFRIGNFGDTLVALPALRRLRQMTGRARLTLLTFRPEPQDGATVECVTTLAGMSDRVVTYPRTIKSPNDAFALLHSCAALRSVRHDTLFYLPPPQRNPRQVRRDRMFFRLCGIRRIIGPEEGVACYPRDANGRLMCVREEWRRLLDIVNLAAERSEGGGGDGEAPVLLPPNEAVAGVVRKYLNTRGIGVSAALVGIAPGSNMASKRWPWERYREVGSALIAGAQVVPVVVGGAAERELGDTLVRAWGCGVNAAGQFDVGGSAELLRQCRLYVGNDTGTMHLAASVGTRCVALFSGRDSPGRWNPYGPGHIVLRHWTPCEGCMATECKVAGHPCMTAISVDEVVQAALSILASASASAVAKVIADKEERSAL